MTGLVLKLAPHERILINGAVIENGDRRTRFNIMTPNAHILRLRDAIHPDQANTPVRRVCLIAQMALSGDAKPELAAQQVMRGIDQLTAVFRDADSTAVLQEAARTAAAGSLYTTLRLLRQLLPTEERLLHACSQAAPNDPQFPP